MYVRVFQDDIKVCISRLGKADLPSLVWMGLTHSVESLKNKMSKWEVLLPDWTQNSFSQLFLDHKTANIRTGT